MPRLFDTLEEPCAGWSLRRIEHRISSDAPSTWIVEIMRDKDAVLVAFEHESLHVAWVRCTARADGLNAKLDDAT